MEPSEEKRTDMESAPGAPAVTEQTAMRARRRKSDRHPPLPILDDVMRVSTTARAVVSERDHLIRAARREGASWAELAEASGLSRSGVRRVCERSDRIR